MEIRVYDEEAIGLMTQVAYEIQEKKKSVEKAVNIVLGNNPHLITQPEEEKEEMDAPVRAVPEVHDEVILLIIQKVLDRYNRGEISPATALLKVKVATELLD